MSALSGRRLTSVKLAKLDIGHCVAPGLFVPIARASSGKREKLHVTVKHDDFHLTWRGSDQLDVGDQSALIALAVLGKEKGRKPVPAKLLVGANADAQSITVYTSYAEIMRMCGISSRNEIATERMRERIRRLRGAVLWVRKDSLEYSHGIIKSAAMDGGGIAVTLNPLLTHALSGGQHAAIFLEERNALGDLGKAVHAYISARVRQGNHWEYTLEQLEDHIYGQLERGHTRRNRHRALRAALRQIGRLPAWGVSDVMSTTFLVCRRPASKPKQPCKSSATPPAPPRPASPAESAAVMGPYELAEPYSIFPRNADPYDHGFDEEATMRAYERLMTERILYEGKIRWYRAELERQGLGSGINWASIEGCALPDSYDKGRRA